MLTIDGTKPPIRWPKNPDDQEKDYSGKKKAHRKKNLIFSSRRSAAYLGVTSPSSMHDKKLADESGFYYPLGTFILKDSAFQSHEPPGTLTLQPKGRELHSI